MSSESPATADICDFHVERPTRLRVVDPCLFQDYGKKKSFSGEIETIRCFESNPLVRETVGSNGKCFT
jgi:regulator of ribonuclease activity A